MREDFRSVDHFYAVNPERERSGELDSGLCECGCGQAAPIAKRTRRDLGHIRGEPLRFVRGHWLRKPLVERYEVRDCGFVTPCHIWIGSMTSAGYGEICVGGRKYLAHRFLFEHETGQTLPKSIVVHHRCEQPPCINTHHMKPLSRPDHVRRHAAARIYGRSAL